MRDLVTSGGRGPGRGVLQPIQLVSVALPREKERREESVTDRRHRPVPVACDVCGVALPPHSGPGRPRIRCRPCASAPVVGRLWRQAHPDRVIAYRVARRERELAARRAAMAERAAALAAPREPWPGSTR